MTKIKDINTIEISDICKSFNSTEVVDRISFDVKQNEIFGLIGPNGAGKTTTIRMIMDIIKADSGRIEVLGESFSEKTKSYIGYLPEERGLYPKLTVIQVLTYLAKLKGVENRQANTKADILLEKVGLLPHRKKKISELSRGMGQLVQFLAAIIHDPRIIILDEPFANLDPVNTELLKEIIYELRDKGCSLILSTHRMNEVEELSDRIFMINKGRGVLYGEINEIKSRYRSNTIQLEYTGELGGLDGVTVSQGDGGSTELLLSEGTTSQTVLEQLVNRGTNITRFEVSTPPLHDIFLQVVGEMDE